MKANSSVEPGSPGDWRTTTAEIQQALDQVADRGGGRVTIRPGRYDVATVRLPSGVELHLEEGALLVAAHEWEGYPEAAWRRVVWAEDAADVALTGEGAIDCRGEFRKAAEPEGPPFPVGTGMVGGYYRNLNSPRPVLFHGCRNVRIEGVQLLNSGEWHCYLLFCDHALIDGIRIRQTAHSVWTDGIDLESCRNVVVRNCDVETGDDAVCIKTGKRGRAQSSHNILVEDCRLVSETNCFKIGNEVSHDVSNVTVRRCRMEAHPDRQAPGPFGGISIHSADGAVVSNVHVSDVEILDARAPFFVKLGRGGGYNQDDPPDSELRNIVLERVTARVTDAKDQAGITSSITGYQGRCVENVTLRDVDIEVRGGETPDPGPVPDIVDRYLETPCFGVLPAFGLYARFVRNLQMDRVRLSSCSEDERPPSVFESVEGRSEPVLAQVSGHCADATVPASGVEGGTQGLGSAGA